MVWFTINYSLMYDKQIKGNCRLQKAPLCLSSIQWTVMAHAMHMSLLWKDVGRMWLEVICQSISILTVFFVIRCIFMILLLFRNWSSPWKPYLQMILERWKSGGRNGSCVFWEIQWELPRPWILLRTRHQPKQNWNTQRILTRHQTKKSKLPAEQRSQKLPLCLSTREIDLCMTWCDHC